MKKRLSFPSTWGAFALLLAIFSPSDSVASEGGGPPESIEPEPEAPPKPVERLPVRIHPRMLVGYGTALGAAMITIGAVWALGWRGVSLATWFPAQGGFADLVLGAALGTIFAVAAYHLLDYVPALQRVEKLLLATLDMPALRPHHALVFGLLAGIPEEILFRGAMQPVLGLGVTSIIFGALHAITVEYFVYATLAGAGLGLLAVWSGGLWAAIAAHTAIDTIMFLLLIRKWRRLHP